VGFEGLEKKKKKKKFILLEVLLKPGSP